MLTISKIQSYPRIEITLEIANVLGDRIYGDSYGTRAEISFHLLPEEIEELTKNLSELVSVLEKINVTNK